MSSALLSDLLSEVTDLNSLLELNINMESYSMHFSVSGFFGSVFLKLIHIVVCVWSSLLLIAEQYSTACTYHSIFIHSLVVAANLKRACHNPHLQSLNHCVVPSCAVEDWSMWSIERGRGDGTPLLILRYKTQCSFHLGGSLSLS